MTQLITNEDRIWYEHDLIEIGIRIHTIPKYENKIRKMSNVEFIAFRNDIKIRGLQEPIRINPQGTVLHGHNRTKGCRELKIQLRCTIKEFDNPLDEEEFVNLANLNQRHLTVGDITKLAMEQEAIEAARIKQRESERRKGIPIGSIEPITQPEKAAQIAANKMGLTYTRFVKGKIILTKGPEKMKRQFLTGELKADKGYRIIQNEIRKTKAKEDALKDLSPDSIPGHYKVYNGSMQEIGLEIADNSVHLLITDPPYDKEHLYLYDETAKLGSRVLTFGGSLFVIVPTGGPSYEYVFDKLRQLGLRFWCPITIKHNGHSKRDHGLRVLALQKTMLWFFKGGKGDKPKMYHDMPNLIESEPPDKTTFEWSQSPKDAKDVINSVTVENQIVLDCFCGEGNFGIAALQMNRYFIGIDKNWERLEITKHKLSKEYEKLHQEGSNESGNGNREENNQQ